jgi:hypothetical protein
MLQVRACNTKSTQNIRTLHSRRPSIVSVREPGNTIITTYTTLHKIILINPNNEFHTGSKAPRQLGHVGSPMILRFCLWRGPVEPDNSPITYRPASQSPLKISEQGGAVKTESEAHFALMSYLGLILLFDSVTAAQFGGLVLDSRLWHTEIRKCANYKV